MGLLKKELGDSTVGDQWATQLESCEAYYVEDVCADYADMKRPLPEPMDRLIQVIVTEARNALDRDRQRWVQHQKYHQKPTEAMKRTCHDRWYPVPRWLNERRNQDSEASEKEYQLRMDEYFNYIRDDREGEKPEWFELYEQLKELL